MTGKKHALHSDLKRVDARRARAADYEEIPELDDAFFDRADIYEGKTLIKRGRPKSSKPKQMISLRLDPDVLQWFKSEGRGYQARIGDALRAYMESRTNSEAKRKGR